MSEEAKRSYFTVEGVEYDFPDEMTGRELMYLQSETGLRSGEISEALDAGDIHALLAVCVVAMRRSGKDTEIEQLSDLPVGSDKGIDFFEDDGRPTEAAASGGKTSSGAKAGTRRSRASTA